jgi:DNA primase
MVTDPSHTKYLIKATIHTDGIVEKSDIIGAVFGQTEGLMGSELDLRDLQKSARIGRIEVDITQKGGKTSGNIELPSAMDKVESCILAAGLETIDRIGPAKATILVQKVEDTRVSRRKQVIDRSKELLAMLNEDPSQDSGKIADEVRNAVQIGEITRFRNTKIPCGPGVEEAESIIIVEGRSDVLNLLKSNIKNTIAVEGTSVAQEIIDLSKEKTTTIFVDGDRGGELIAKELLQTCEVDFVARAPATREVEELPHKLMQKCLRNKLSADQFISQMGIVVEKKDDDRKAPARGGRDSRDSRDGDKKGGDRKAPARNGREPREPREQREPRVSKDDESSEDAPARKAPARGRAKKDDDSSDAKPARKAPARGRAKKDDSDDSDAKKPARKAAHDPRAGFRDTLSGLSGSLKAVIIDAKGKETAKDVPVRELADTLKNGKGAHTVVFDGVITQRLLDIAAEREIKTIIGVKMGNVTKAPDTVEILTRDDLE